MNKRILLFAAGLFISLGIQAQIEYGTGNWNADSLGNHRVVVELKTDADNARVHIDWRRKDMHPETIDVILIDAQTGKEIDNIYRHKMNREFGEFAFACPSGKGLYYFYYLPNTTSGSRNYPTVKYNAPENNHDKQWALKLGLPKRYSVLRKAEAIKIEAISDLHSFFPMEVIATKEETGDLISGSKNKDYLIFPEKREFPVKMWNDLPKKWIDTGISQQLNDTADKSEYFAFQLAAYAISKDIENFEVSYSDLKHSEGYKIPQEEFTCFHLEGIDWTGEKMKKKTGVKMGNIQPLWFGIMIPDDAPTGMYQAKIKIKPDGFKAQNIELNLYITDKIIADHGDNEAWRHSRLRWLNSKIAFDDDVVAPYTPMRLNNTKIELLGREIEIAENGLPSNIASFFAPEMTRLTDHPINILSEPVSFNSYQGNKKIDFPKKELSLEKKGDGLIVLESTEKNKSLEIRKEARFEYDGFVSYKMQYHANQDIDIDQIELKIPLNNQMAEYMLGLGRKGSFAPDDFNWKWDPYFNCDGPWIGSVNAGIQITFRDENYERPLNTNFYHEKPLKMPVSWSNDYKGGIRLKREEGKYYITAYTGARSMKKGEELHFNFNMIITPFRMLDTKSHWNNRYFHSFKPLDTIAEQGANTINVHHATDINPFINYPFMLPDKMKKYIDDAHERDFKVKIYYTVRELSNICPEIWALKSLGNEILSYGPGGGYSWLQEHLDNNYIAAWFVPPLKDAAIINSGVSRWHNYYLEGLNWLVKHVGIDGLYIDDVAFDRTIMKRARKILERGNPGALIDLHSANQFNPRDGFSNSANLYLEHFAYIDRLWFGEYFEYDKGPEYWMTEVSGLPFGLMGEMLWEGGNKWRGMLYGMTARLPWAGDPRPIWKIWDDFGINQSEMIGYWVKDRPVKTGRPDILATSFVREGKTMVAIASWAHGPVPVALQIDWKALGLNPENVKIHAPEIKDFQEESSFRVGENIKVPMGKGWILIIE